MTQANPPLVLETSGSKPGYRTTEFWLTVVALTLSAFFAAGVVGDDSAAVKIAGVIGGILSALGYQVSRGAAKKGDGSKPGWQSSEFWLTLAAHGLGLCYASGAIGEGTFLYQILGIAQVALTQMGYTVSRTVAKKPNPAALLPLLESTVGSTQNRSV